MDSITYPIRINRYLYLKQYCSRREADRLIEQGKISINGKVAVLGQQVHEGDTVGVPKELITKEYVYYMYNKPRGIVSHNPQRGEKSVEDISGLGPHVFPIGRLDKDSHGLMLLTNDGRIVHTLLHPDYAHEREYQVRVDKNIKERDLRALREGVNIEGYTTKPAQVHALGDATFSIILTEGKKHQIRRMCVALGYQVQDLKRIRMLHLLLDVPESTHRPLSEPERAMLLQHAGIVPTPLAKSKESQ